MGRPSLPLGTAGRIRTYRKADGWQARTKFRDYDGQTREIERWARSESGARGALAEAIRDRGTPGPGGAMSRESRVSALAEVWWAQVIESGLSPSTERVYRDRLDRQILPALGKLRVRELSVALVDRHLATVKAKHGPGLAKTVKSVLSGICKLGCRRDLMPSNPCRDVAPIAAKAKRAPQALSAAELAQLRTFLTYDKLAVKHDLIDLVSFMCATGVRLGEACAVTWDAVDLDAGTVEIRGTVLRLKSTGLTIKDSTKTKAGQRILELPLWCIEMLRTRRAKARTKLVLPTERGNLRDPSNTRKALQQAYARLGYTDQALNTHVFRKTVATLMDEAGIPARAVADQLGHSKVTTTMDIYMGRKVRATGAALALADLNG